tara:strand:- start:2704 stop:3063 length:360 start_codon:yes stop_codon:yes gene_type:complete
MKRKKCKRCNSRRTINSFYPDKRSPDGHATICRSCITTGRKITRGNRTTGTSSNFTVLYCPCETEKISCVSYIICGTKQLACPSFSGWVMDGKLNNLSITPTHAEFKRLFPNDRYQSNS